MSRTTLTLLATALAGLIASAPAAAGATASFASPVLDKWMYANVDGTTGGQVTAAPLFAFLNTAEDEDRLGALIVGFDTSALIAPGLGSSTYAVTSVKLTLTVLTADTFLYDGTHDSYRVHLPPGDPSYQADADPGHPVEVFGVGLRNGFTRLSGSLSGASHLYHENSPFGTTGAASFRNAYPLGLNAGGALYDVADHVSARQEAQPFGVGTAALTAGTSVPEGTEFTFQLQLTEPTIRSYLQSGLNAGILGLYVSSLHAAAGQTGAQTYPRFLTREGADFLGAPEYAPHLEITYTLVPEPSATLCLVLGIGLLTAGRAFRRRHFFS